MKLPPDFKIISGGQTGADRAALDWAIRHRIAHGGFCPLGRRAEDGVIEARYQLQELSVADYAARTERNVMEANGTVIFTIRETMSGGTLLTAQCATKHQKPLLHCCQQTNANNASTRLQEFIDLHQIRILNVAGPRASEEPEIENYVAKVLDCWLALISLHT